MYAENNIIIGKVHLVMLDKVNRTIPWVTSLPYKN